MSDNVFPNFSQYVKASNAREAIEASRYKVGRKEPTIDGQQWIIDSVTCTPRAYRVYEVHGTYRKEENDDHPRLYGVTHV